MPWVDLELFSAAIAEEARDARTSSRRQRGRSQALLRRSESLRRGLKDRRELRAKRADPGVPRV